MIHSNRFLRREKWLGAAIAFAFGLGACQTNPEPGAPPVEEPAVAGTLVVGPARDVGSPVAAAELALREDLNGFRGGYLTHDVSISEGIIDLTPKHFDLATDRQVIGGAIGLQTTGVFAGGERLDGGAGLHARHAPNVVRIARGDVIEEVTNREDGVEQAWHFATRPPATGDLIVEVGVAGHELVATNDTGLHFRSPAGLGVRYGHAVWRDAGDGEFEIPVRFEGGRILITVPEDVVQASVYPAVLDPLIVGEVFVDAPVNGTTGANSRNQDVASDGTGYFAVWQDQRDSRNDDIFGARVNATGAVVDANGIRINAAAGVQQNPVVAHVGTGYVVAWENVVATGNADIVAAFVSNAGAVTQLGTIAGTAGNETGAAIAARGNQALLVWGDGANVRGAVFGAGAFGAAFDVSANVTNLEKEPAVSGNAAGDYLVTFTETIAAGNDDIRGQRVTAAGALSGAAFTIADEAGLQTQSAAAFAGTDHIVAWNSGSNIFASRVTTGGAVLDPTPVTISAATNAQTLPDVACTAAECLIAWQDSRNAAASVRDVYGAAVSSALAITANDILIAGAARTQDTPALAVGGTQYFATWADNRDLEYTYVRGSRMDGAGAVMDTDGIILVTAVSRLQAPSVAQSTTFTDVFMSDTQKPDVNLVHVRFAASGTQADNPPKLVSNAAGAQVTPSAAFVGGNSLVVWGDTRGADRDIYAARVDLTTGAVIDAMGIPVSTAVADQFVPKIASAGTSALVVWQDRRNGAASGFDIYAAVIDASGAVTVNDIAICTGAGDQGGPSVAYSAEDGAYLVVWTDPAGATVDIRGARVSAAGALLDANCGAAISDAAGSQFGADVTYGSGRFVVVWEDRRNDAALGDIYGARVTAAGALVVEDPAGIPIAELAGSAQTAPSVAFNAAYPGIYLAAWTDARNATTGTDIFGAQITGATGAALAAFTISAAAGNEGSVDVTTGTGQNPFNVAYNKQNIALGTVRMQLRRVALGITGGQTCSVGTQCASGFCADGRCCDTACGGNVVTDCQACSAARGAVADGTCTIIPAGLQYICRDYAVRTDIPQCDVREYCDGESAACPADLGQNGGAVCVKMGGAMGTCPAADAGGAPHFCGP